MNLDAVGHDVVVLAVDVEPYGHARVSADHGEDGRHLLHQGRRPLGPDGVVARRDPLAHVPDDVAGAQNLGLGQIQRAGDAVAHRPGQGGVAAAGVQIDGGGRQRLVQFMRQGRGHFPHRVQPPDAVRLVFRTLFARGLDEIDDVARVAQRLDGFGEPAAQLGDDGGDDDEDDGLDDGVRLFAAGQDKVGGDAQRHGDRRRPAIRHERDDHDGGKQRQIVKMADVLKQRPQRRRDADRDAGDQESAPPAFRHRKPRPLGIGRDPARNLIPRHAEQRIRNFPAPGLPNSARRRLGYYSV